MQTTGYEKFEHVLSLLDRAPAKPEGYVGFSVLTEKREIWDKFSTVASKYFDTVFEYIHANFAYPETGRSNDGKQDIEHIEVVQCRDILENRDTAYENMRKIPPVLLETVFPVAVAAYIVSKTEGGLDLPVAPYKTDQFNEFHNRYGFMIIEGAFRNRRSTKE